MKITFLLLTADAVGGTERAVFNQAAELVGNHDVRVMSILKTQPQLFFPIDERIRVDYLIDRTGPAPSPSAPRDWPPRHGHRSPTGRAPWSTRPGKRRSTG